jgi:cobalt transporter subunit CbtB
MDTVRTGDVSTATAVTTQAVPALATIMCGVLIIFVVGFLQAPVAHNAAHDTRHANGFPCH